MPEFLHPEPGEPGSGRPSLAEIHARMRAAFERCRADGAPAAFLNVGIEGLARIEELRGRAERERVLAAVIGLVCAQPRIGDVHAYPQRGGVVAMLTECSAEACEMLARLVVEGGRRLALAGGRTLRTSLSIGIAASQAGEEHFFETMLLVAEEGAAVASAGGGECVVHTELYGLHQRRLAREMPERVLPAPRARDGRAASPAARVPVASSPAPAAPAQVAAAAATPPVDVAGEVAALRGQLRQALAAEASPGAPPAAARRMQELEERMTALAERWMLDVLRRSLAQQAAAHGGEVERLEQRIAKLDAALEQSEREVRRLAAALDADHGLQSSYRRVQGLDDHDVHYELKLALMEQILKANLQLYSQISLKN